MEPISISLISAGSIMATKFAIEYSVEKMHSMRIKRIERKIIKLNKQYLEELNNKKTLDMFLPLVYENGIIGMINNYLPKRNTDIEKKLEELTQKLNDLLSYDEDEI